MFHKRLKEAVKLSGFVVKEIADKSGVAKGTLDNWLGAAKQTMPSAEDAAKVARVLGVTVEFLVFGDEIIGGDRFGGILEDLRALPLDRLEDVRRLIHPWAEEARRASVNGKGGRGTALAV